MKKTQAALLRYLAGYALGISLFMILIPYTIWLLSSTDNILFKTHILPFDYVRLAVSIALFSVGMLFVVWSNTFLLFKGKGGPADIADITISPRTKFLVTQGPYKYTRNPMAFGANTVYISIAIYLNSLGCLIVTAIFFLLTIIYVIPMEERRLLDDFGTDYMKYKSETPAVIPRPKKISFRC